MNSENYYVENKETGKLNIYTTKEYYSQLPIDEKATFSKFCLWSKHQGCWISKGKAENCYYLKARLKDLNFSDQGITGQALSFEEQIKRSQSKAEARSQMAEQRSIKAEKKSGDLLDKAHKMGATIPFGQPILVGHHSEKSDRRFRQSIHNTYDKGFAEMDKANYYAGKAETAKYTAEGKKFQKPEYLSNRIKECEKYIRLFERKLKGKDYIHSAERPISEKSREIFTQKINEEQEKVKFYQECLQKLGLPEGVQKKESSKRKRAKKNNLK